MHSWWGELKNLTDPKLLNGNVRVCVCVCVCVHTSRPSLFDPLTLVLSILILFHLSVFIKKTDFQISPESRQREQNQTSERKYFVIYLLRKIIQCYISVSCKSMWTSWISSSFKGEIRVPSVQRCFQSVQWLSNVSTWPVLFKEQGSIKVWSCLWKWIMSLSKEIIEDLRKRVDVAHHARKDYKTISKEFGLYKSTIGQIVYKWKKLHIYIHT